eukprot:scaffold31311_cov64-Phaeocystis_antarctica.AAC.3
MPSTSTTTCVTGGEPTAAWPQRCSVIAMSTPSVLPMTTMGMYDSAIAWALDERRWHRLAAARCGTTTAARSRAFDALGRESVEVGRVAREQSHARVGADGEPDGEQRAYGDLLGEHLRQVCRRELASSQPLHELRDRLPRAVAAAADEHREEGGQDDMSLDQALEALDHPARDTLEEHERKQPREALAEYLEHGRVEVGALGRLACVQL